MSLRAYVLIFCCALIVIGQGSSIRSYEELLLALQDANISIDEMFRTPSLVLLNGSEFDYIIVGGGSAGSVLANRLSADGRHSVALLEAGGFENAISRMPGMCGYTQMSPLNWGYKTVPQKCACQAMNNQQCPKAAGKVLGGGGSLNFMLYSRGTPADHNCPRQKFNIPNWDHDTLWPYILKSEKAMLMNGTENDALYHSKTGMITVRHPNYRSIIAASYLQAMQQAGVPYLDYNGKCILGVSPPQTTTNEQGQRFSPYRGYVQPIANPILNPLRKLRVYTGAEVKKIVYDPNSKVVSGVMVKYLGLNLYIKAKKEVILSAGVFNSAKLLMLSGIGPKQCLEPAGIKQQLDLPVGQGIREHVAFMSPVVTVNTTGETIYLGDPDIWWNITKYAVGKDNTRYSLPIFALESLAFLKFANSSNAKNTPDVELIFTTGSYASDYGTGMKIYNNLKDSTFRQYYKPLYERGLGVPGQDHFVALMVVSHPHSRGHMCLNARNPHGEPHIDPNMLGDSRDVDLLYRANKFFLSLLKTPAMRRLNAQLLPMKFPGCERYRQGSKCYWRCVIRHNSYMLDHEMGSCRMGCRNDPAAVVDSRLCVYGMQKLRVVDNSIWPCTTSGHTNYMAMMIAERAADLILNEQCSGQQEQCVYEQEVGQQDPRDKIGYSDCESECQQEEPEDEVENEQDYNEEAAIELQQCENN